jgi:hypothetical protein
VNVHAYARLATLHAQYVIQRNAAKTTVSTTFCTI